MKKESKILEPNHYNWHIFPIFGIDVIQEDDWYEHPFEDVYLVNHLTLISFCKQVNLKSDLINFILKPNKQSFLLVRTINLNTDSKSEFQLIKESKQKVYLAASIICIFYLYFSKIRFGICLEEQLYFANSHTVFSLFKNKNNTGFTFSMNSQNNNGELPITTPKVNFQIRSNFKDYFVKNHFFRELIKSIETNTFSSLRESIVNFYLKISSSFPEFQFLGALSSLEILFKQKGNINQKIFQPILNSILEKSEFDSFFVENKLLNTLPLLTIRNNIVHSSKSCSQNDVYRATRLTLKIYFSYCKILNLVGSEEKTISLLIYVNELKKHNEDIFGTLKSWNHLQIEHDKTDWVKLSLLNSCELNSYPFNEMDDFNFCVCVNCLIDLGIKNKVLDSYESMLYYIILPERFTIISSFQIFKKYFDENIISIKAKSRELLSDLNFKID